MQIYRYALRTFTLGYQYPYNLVSTVRRILATHARTIDNLSRIPSIFDNLSVNRAVFDNLSIPNPPTIERRK